MSTDINIERNQLILEFINKLLVNMNKPEISVLTDFKNVTKDEISTNQNNELAKVYVNKFLKYFKKGDIKYYETTRAKNYVIILLKNIIKPDYKLSYSQKIKMKNTIMNYEAHYYITPK